MIKCATALTIAKWKNVWLSMAQSTHLMAEIEMTQMTEPYLCMLQTTVPYLAKCYSFQLKYA